MAIIRHIKKTAILATTAGLICCGALSWAETDSKPTLADDYRQQYNLDKASISENEQQQAAGHFELRGILSSSTSTAAIAGGELEPLNNSEAQALKFLNNNLELFGIENAALDLRLISNQADSFGNQHLRYQRAIGNLQLKGMDIIVHINSNGEVDGSNGNIVRASENLLLELNFLNSQGSVPALTEQQLLGLAAQNLNVPVTELLLQKAQALAINEQPYVIWEIEVSRKGRLQRTTFTIADTSASILSRRSNQRHQF